MTIRRSWVFAGGVLIPSLSVLEAFVYYPSLVQSGTLSPDADSIGIPIGQTVSSAPIRC